MPYRRTGGIGFSRVSYLGPLLRGRGWSPQVPVHRAAAPHEELVRLGWRPPPDLVAKVLARAVEGVLIAGGRARWTLSWTGRPARVVVVSSVGSVRTFSLATMGDHPRSRRPTS